MPWWWNDEHVGSLGADWRRLDEERRGTFWRVWKLIQDAGEDVDVLGVEAWRAEGWQACLKVLMERSRRRKLQRLPDAVIDMYHDLPISQPRRIQGSRVSYGYTMRLELILAHMGRDPRPRFDPPQGLGDPGERHHVGH